MEEVGRRSPPRISQAAYAEKLAGRRQTVDGLEIPDERPVAPAVGFVRQPSMFDHMRALVKGELVRREAEAAGVDTFEEADDFDVPDELVPISGFEHEPQFDPAAPPAPAASDAPPAPATSPPGGEVKPSVIAPTAPLEGSTLSPDELAAFRALVAAGRAEKP